MLDRDPLNRGRISISVPDLKASDNIYLSPHGLLILHGQVPTSEMAVLMGQAEDADSVDNEVIGVSLYTWPDLTKALKSSS